MEKKKYGRWWRGDDYGGDDGEVTHNGIVWLWQRRNGGVIISNRYCKRG